MWSANQKVNNDTGSRTQWEPAIALDGANNAYAVWSDQRDGNKTPDTNIYFSKRSASTGSWSANVRVNNDTQGTAIQGAPAIAVRNTGDAVSVWEDHRSNQLNIYSSRLPAGSSTWAANIRVTDNTASHKYTPDVVVGADGTAYAVWEDDRSGNSDVWFSTLPSGASAWTANVEVSDDPGTAAQYDPHIGIDAAGDLIVSWQDDRVANTQVRMRRRLAGNQTWEASLVVSDAAAILVATALGVSADGNAFAVWQDARGTSYDIWGAEYTFSTNAWSTAALVSDDPGATAQMRPTVARTSSEVMTAWRDDRVTGGDIRARRRTTSQGTDHFTYAYDGLNRLTAVTGPVPETFSFDAASNIATRTGPAATNSYDVANRQTSDGTRSFVWDGADRLVTRGADTFTYDALSRLTSATVGGSTRNYAYDGDGLLTARPEGAVLWDSSVAPAALLGSASDRVVYGLGPLYIARADGSTLTLALDGLGSVRAELSDAGAVARSLRYAAYGTLAASSGGSPTLLGYAGEFGDISGAMYLRARWLDPSQARFMSRDPFSGTTQLPVSLNAYAYASAPTTDSDPSGLWTGALCVSASFSAGGYSSYQFCPILVASNGEVGWTATIGAGLSPSLAVSLTGNAQGSNGNSISDLLGPFTDGGASAGAVLVGGTDFFWNQSASVRGAQANVGTGLRLTGVAPAEVHLAATNTTGGVWFNIFDIFRRIFAAPNIKRGAL